jgi:hypothetical protein
MIDAYESCGGVVSSSRYNLDIAPNLNIFQLSDVGEFAARVCYASDGRMLTVPGFLQDRLREGHEDVIEHFGWSVRFFTKDIDKFIVQLFDISRHFSYGVMYNIGPCFENAIDIWANARVWMKFCKRGFVTNEPTLVNTYMMSELTNSNHAEFGESIKNNYGQVVTVLCADTNSDKPDGHKHLCVLVENVSRSLTHQLVRHRTLSFSQESQRYVDLQKGGWTAVVPPSITANTSALSSMLGCWNASEDAYESMRENGIRKEDARYLLPNATTTRIVVSGNLDAWKHFIGLRTARAAQWEIRALAATIESVILKFF